MAGVGAEPLVRKVKSFTGAQTAAAVWTPASGKRIILTGIYVLTSAAATLALFIDTNTEANLLPGSGTFPDTSGFVELSLRAEKFDVDKAIKFTSSAGNATVILYGYEE